MCKLAQHHTNDGTGGTRPRLVCSSVLAKQSAHFRAGGAPIAGSAGGTRSAGQRRAPPRLRGIGRAVRRVSPVGLTNTRNAARPMLLVSPFGLRFAPGAPTNPPTKHGRCHRARCFWGGLRSRPAGSLGGWGEMRNALAQHRIIKALRRCYGCR
ncbi:hypothetical protein HYPDE_27018 [Hyphomicrobium denitrificans 1NES1]|uniref:Uncharacterized protein n=1 Tax=Hyphomicrobium denitrificans 1NES1 TaxID=670307 RepID=N0B0V3_9HYPH|nr:hypothetical protein HYPDE_27018 [Hyphomicrobium denitrificans 1NES1]